jgi:hypothetical protein
MVFDRCKHLFASELVIHSAGLCRQREGQRSRKTFWKRPQVLLKQARLYSKQKSCWGYGVLFCSITPLRALIFAVLAKIDQRKKEIL